MQGPEEITTIEVEVNGQCVECGYERTGLASGSPCPECGYTGILSCPHEGLLRTSDRAWLKRTYWASRSMRWGAYAAGSVFLTLFVMGVLGLFFFVVGYQPQIEWSFDVLDYFMLLSPVGVLVYMVSWWPLTQPPPGTVHGMRSGRGARWTALLLVAGIIVVNSVRPSWFGHVVGAMVIEVALDTLFFAHILCAARYFRRLEWRSQGWTVQRAVRYQGVISIAVWFYAISLAIDLGCPAKSILRPTPGQPIMLYEAPIAPVGLFVLPIAWGNWFFGIAGVPAKLKAELEANRANPPAPNVAPNAGSDAAPGSSAGTA